MTIDTSGKWWVGDKADDIAEYLKAYASPSVEVNEFRLSVCECGSIDFFLFADDDEGVAKRVCVRCAHEHFICDSAEFWEDSRAEKWNCVECKSETCNVGVGFSLYDDRSAVHWIYVGERCSKCSILGCFAGWKVGYAPSLQLLEKV